MSDLTHVELLWLEKRIENWVRFGRAAEEQILDKRRRILSFAPGSIFAFVRWTSNDFGTIISRIDIVRAVPSGQRCVTVPYVRPGGDILLRLSGWPNVERVLQIADAVEALDIDPADAAPDYWHHVHNRLSVNEVPRAYTRSRHKAWLHRRRIARDRSFDDAFNNDGGGSAVAFHDRRETHPTLYMERVCKRARRPLPVAPHRQTHCRRSCGDLAARTSHDIPRRGKLSAPQRATAEARVGAAWADGLPRPFRHLGRQCLGRRGARHDSRGRPLPIWKGCRVVADREVFVMNWQSAESLDGRYFGVLPANAVIGKAEPFWTGEEE
jgi:hypothetical protein